MIDMIDSTQIWNERSVAGGDDGRPSRMLYHLAFGVIYNLFNIYKVVLSTNIILQHTI